MSARYKPGYQDGTAWLDDLKWAQYPADEVLMDLPPLDPQGLSDVLACMERPLDRVASQAELIEQLYRLSEQGDPLLIRLYTDQLWQQRHQVDRLTVAALQHLQPGFEGFLKYWYHDQARGGHYRQPAWEALFMLLAAALAPLKRDDLRAVAERAGFSPREPLEDMLADAFSVVIGDGDQQGYAFIHPRLNAHFLEQQHDTWERQRSERAFIDRCGTVVMQLNSGELRPESCPEYVLRTYVAHLRRGRGDLECYFALLSDGWRRAWFALEGASNGFLTDVQQVLEVLGEHNERLWRTERRPILRIGEEIRCLLCNASVRSLSNNVPPDLIVKLVGAGIWYERQALRVVEHLDDYNKAEALRKLAKRLRNSKIHLHQPLDLAEHISDESARARALSEVAEHLEGEQRHQALARALEAAERISDESHRAWALRTAKTRLTDLAKLYLVTEVAGQSQTTLDAKRRDLTRFLAFYHPLYGHGRPDEWFVSVTKAFLKQLRGQRFAQASLVRIYVTVRHCARWLDRKFPGLFPLGCPTDGVKPPAEPTADWKGLTRLEEIRLLNAAQTPCAQPGPGTK